MAGYRELVRLLDPPRARAIARALRTDLAAPSRRRSPDPSLVALVERPFESVEDAHRRLAELESRLRVDGDRRAVFLTIYSRMTGAVRDGIESDQFLDPEWMRTYTVTFADYYRRAFLAFERDSIDAVPAPWQVAFGTAVDGTALVAQDAFLGINAHINYDLALTLRDVGIDPDRPAKRADHRRIDEVLSALVDAQQTALADLYAPGLASVDGSLGRFDELLSLTSLTEARAHAWRVGAVLTDVEWAPARRYARWVLATTATGGAAFVRSPPVDPTLMSALQRVERGQFSLEEALGLLDARLDTLPTE